MRRLATTDADFARRFAAILEDGRDTTTRVDAAVSAIIAEDRADARDAACCASTARFDGWKPGRHAGRCA
jgi:histidinol dehydrogenase